MDTVEGCRVEKIYYEMISLSMLVLTFRIVQYIIGEGLERFSLSVSFLGGGGMWNMSSSFVW